MEVLGTINRILYKLNTETKRSKPLKRLEKVTGIEPGTIILLVWSILFSMVLFDVFSKLIVESVGLIYPAYGTLTTLSRYWYTYWFVYSFVTVVASMLPTSSFILAARFLIAVYMSAPEILESSKLHEYLQVKILNLKI
jgi:hypothetical protein